MNNEVILSLNLSSDSGAALFVDETFIAAGKERLNREIYTRAFPYKSIYEVMNGCSTPAFIYSMITQLLDFSPSRHEGKITGLAVYFAMTSK